MDKAKYAEEITTAIFKINEYDVYDPFRTESLRNTFSDLKSSLNTLPEYIYSEVDLGILKPLHSYLKKLAFTTIDKLIESEGPEYKAYAAEFEKICYSIAEIINTIRINISSISQANSYNELEKKSASYLKKIQDIQLELVKKEADYSAQLERMEAATKKAEEIPEKLAEVNAFKPIVDEYANYLDNVIHEEYRKSARNNLWLLAGTLVALFLFLIGAYELICHKIALLSNLVSVDKVELPFDKMWYQRFILFSVLISKIGIIAFLTYMLYFFGRNYSAFRHNSIVVKHRAYSVRLYEKFVFHPDISAGTRDSITSKAADAIFSHQETGFLKSEGMKLNVPNLVNMSNFSDGHK